MKHFIKRVRNYVKRRYRSYKDKPMKMLIGMTSMEEREYWKDYAAKVYTGAGCIVDLGCWFGSTTYSLAEGLKKNQNLARGQRKIYAYDLFLWEDWMNSFVKDTKWENGFQKGESFQAVFENNLKRYKKYIVTRCRDLTTEPWQDGHIEFLLVDAMKSWDLLNAIQINFYPYLIPGKSILVQQDFCHYYTYWIHLLTYRLKDYFEVIGIHGTSLILKQQKVIPSSALFFVYSLQNFTFLEIEKSFEYSMSLVPQQAKGSILAAKIMCLKELKGVRAAIAELDKASSSGLEHHDINQVRKLLTALV